MNSIDNVMLMYFLSIFYFKIIIFIFLTNIDLMIYTSDIIIIFYTFVVLKTRTVNYVENLSANEMFFFSEEYILYR